MPFEAPPVEDVAPPQEQAVSVPEPVAEPELQAEAVPAETAVPMTQADAAASPSANTDTALAASASYALNLPSSEVDTEMAKRKARAERFGTGNAAANGADTNDADMEAEKALERAKRFGTGQTAMGKLDEALPTERERGLRKRGRTDEDSTLDDAGLRRGFGGHGRGRGGRFRGRGGRDNSRRRQGDRPTGVVKTSGAFSSDADRLAAEARKKKFAT